jgi:hypothetical protein
MKKKQIKNREVVNISCLKNKDKDKLILNSLINKTSFSIFTSQDYNGEEDYLNSLSDEEKEWLNNFLRGYYLRDAKSGKEVGLTSEHMKEAYKNYRRVKNDYFNHNDMRDSFYNEKNLKDDKND